MTVHRGLEEDARSLWVRGDKEFTGLSVSTSYTTDETLIETMFSIT